ncbi:Polycystin cation channel-domain-containing protein [Tribonema minus]|uniref:Polycystin cation channel-domain-containing protein n=1 Tax=Tribonema minus TaxID=303371 RepID=A0A835YMN2_9STRA|nr:Polycystin cation channel-domain-containing protein [Tribonema minus]
MSPPEFRETLRRHLGVERPAPAAAQCPKCHKPVDSGAHLHRCTQGLNVTRHNLLADALFQLLKQVAHLRGLDRDTLAPFRRYAARHGFNKFMDIVFGSNQICLPVPKVQPSADAAQGGARDVQRVLESASQEKIDTYVVSGALDPTTHTLFSAAFDHFGAMSRDTQALLHALAEQSSQGSYNLAQRVAFWRRRTSLALQRALTRVVIDNWNAVIAPDGDVSAYRRIALLQVPRPSPASAEPPAPPASMQRMMAAVGAQARNLATKVGQGADEARKLVTDSGDEVARRHNVKYDAAKTKAIKWLVLYCVFLAVFVSVVFLPKDIGASFDMYSAVNAAILRQEVMVRKTWEEVTSVPETFKFVREALLPSAFTDAHYNGEALGSQGAIAQYKQRMLSENSLVLGKLRLRQMRVKQGSCIVPGATAALVEHCNAGYTAGNLDTTPLFYWGTNVTTAYQSQTTLANIERRRQLLGGSGAEEQEQEQQEEGVRSRGSSVRPGTPGGLGDGGKWVSSETQVQYDGSGYAEDLPVDSFAEALARVQELEAGHWMDERTRALFIDISFYNAGLDEFCHLRLAMEQLATGTVITSYRVEAAALILIIRSLQRDGSSPQYMAAFVLEMVLYVTVIVYMVKTADDIVDDWDSFVSFMKSGWNLIDIGLIVCLLVNICMTAVWMLQAQGLKYVVDPTVKLDQRNDEAYYKLRSCSEHYATAKYFLALAMLLAFLKCLKFIGFTPSLQALTNTIKIAASEMTALLFVMGIIFVGYGVSFQMAFGYALPQYRNFVESLLSLWLMMMGDFDLDELRYVNPALGTILFVSFMMLANFVVLSMLLKIVDVAFASVMQDIHQASDTEILHDVGLAFQAIAHDSYWAVKAQSTLVEAAAYKGASKVWSTVKLRGRASHEAIHPATEEKSEDDAIAVLNGMLKTGDLGGTSPKQDTAATVALISDEQLDGMANEEVTDEQLRDQLALLYHKHRVLSRLTGKLAAGIAETARVRRANVLARKHTALTRAALSGLHSP